MRVLVFTLPEIIEGEASIIEALLSCGVDRVHIRKPFSSRDEVRDLILSIDFSFRDRLTIHDHFSLCEEFPSVGVHLNRRNPSTPPHWHGVTSGSVHSFSEIGSLGDLDYYTLSPIFDSISKEGYPSGFSVEELREAHDLNVIDSRTVALGGVCAEDIPHLHGLGFGGIALLGSIWRESSPERIINKAKKAVKLARMMGCFSLQYITHRNSKDDDVSSAEAAIRGGCKWVQLRMKGVSDQEFIAQAHRLKAICQRHDSIFLLNDRAHLVGQCRADGVHLGRNDIAPSRAREILGEQAIIGGTANNHKDIDRLVSEGVDYIGLGPFRFTTTKENLSPVIGLQGYKRAIEHCQIQGYKVPIVAIGGITEDDIKPIMGCGVSGIALSGTILNAQDSEKATQDIVNRIKI